MTGGKTMKAKLFILAVVFLFLNGCGRCGKDSTIPSNLKPIDKENYNDVYTVYWNYWDSWDNIGREIDTVLIWGYINITRDYRKEYAIIDDSTSAYKRIGGYPLIRIFWHDSISSQIRAIIENSVPDKCFIKASVLPLEYDDNCYSHTVPKLQIISPDNIYFN
jgi:hypothetical protein